MSQSPFRQSNRDRRVLNTLEHYFNIEIHDQHPLLEQVEMRHLAGGEWLMHQGDAGDSLYFLVRGRLQAWAEDQEGNQRGKFLNEIVPGDSVGELSLLTGAARAVGIQAIRDSLLIRIDRAAFETLAHEHPSLVLRLAANVASLLQNRQSKARPSTRNLKGISIVMLDETARSMRFCEQFADQLRASGDTLYLMADHLGGHGAPVDSVVNGESIPHGLVHWLHDQEDENRFVLYQCSAMNQTWSEFAMRQSDMVVFVGDTTMGPALRNWEARLAESSGTAIARHMLVLLQAESGKEIRDTDKWLASRKVDFHVHVRDGHDEDIGRVARIISGTAVGLVLAGGAARGFAHLGVNKAMHELGIPVDWIGGTSIGAIMAGGIASPFTPEEAIELSRAAFVDGKPFSDFTVPLFSLISGNRMERLLREHLDFHIEDLPTPYFCISCHLDTGTMKLHESGYLPDALRASAAIPGMIPPAIVERRLTVDGAVINNLPVDVMQQKPVGTIVAVSISANRQVEVDYKDLPSPWAVLRGRYLPFTRRHRVPRLSTILLKSTELGTLERVELQGQQADVLLSPPVRQFGMTEVKSFDKIVQAGYEHALEELGKWQQQTSN